LEQYLGLLTAFCGPSFFVFRLFSVAIGLDLQKQHAIPTHRLACDSSIKTEYVVTAVTVIGQGTSETV